jgi:ribosomal protein S12 methylthiotransferase
MRRGTTREKTEKLIADIRDRVPGIAIRTTLIAGYPGETATLSWQIKTALRCC